MNYGVRRFGLLYLDNDILLAALTPIAVFVYTLVDLRQGSKSSPGWGVAEGKNRLLPIANVGTHPRDEMLETPGKSKENVNCKWQSRTPVVATQSATSCSRSKKGARYRRSQRARAKQVKVIMQYIDFDIQQNIAKSEKRNTCLRSNATSTAMLSPDPIITPSSSPAPRRSQRHL